MHRVSSFLRSVKIFEDLSSDEIKLISKITSKQELKKGKYLFSEKQPRRALYIIIKGRLELFIKSRTGSKITLEQLKAKDFLGDIGLIYESAHTTSSVALTDLKYLRIKINDLKKLCDLNKSIAIKLLTTIAKSIARHLSQSNAFISKSNGSVKYISGKTRKESDLLGSREVPYDAYYGIQTFRGLENFYITKVSISHYPILIRSLAMVKIAAAMANEELSLIDEEVAKAIVSAGNEILMGKFHDHFVLDMIQGGAGTSTNMNVNEVIANRALEILGKKRGQYKYCHPNNHVNLSQSTNDAYPSALKLAMFNYNLELLSFLDKLIDSFRNKAQEFKDVYKIGRTQLQDAVPMTLGQEFEVFAATLEEESKYLKQNAKYFLSLNLGGTAIGTGINTVKKFGKLALKHLKKISSLDLNLAPNLIESTQSTSSFVTYSSALKQLAIKLSKICNDLRLLSSGPRAGLSEIQLPERQPGSSIMPGKVNPVIPEAVNQACFKVIGNDLTVSLAAEAGQLQLNVMEPVIAKCILESVEMLKNVSDILRFHCVEGIKANKDRCYDYVQNSIGLITALCPYLGYETSSKLAKEALATNKNIYEVVLEKKLLSKKELNQILDPKNMIKPQLKKSFKS